VGVQVDVNLRVTECWVRISLAGDLALSNDLRRNFRDLK
jgi:hypothetical protein